MEIRTRTLRTLSSAPTAAEISLWPIDLCQYSASTPTVLTTHFPYAHTPKVSGGLTANKLQLFLVIAASSSNTAGTQTSS